MNTKQHHRSHQLSALSQEHRDGMLFIQRIRRGLGKISNERLLRYTRWYWKNHIRPHFFQEEKILLPFMPATHPLTVKLQDDHAYIRDLILSLDHEAGEQDFNALCDLIDSHILFEEQQLFVYMEQHLLQSDLDRIFVLLENRPLDTMEWEDPFWL